MPIAVVGCVFVDIKGFPAGDYIPGGRNAGSVAFVHGGVGRNVAEDLANVGLSPRFVSMVDDSAQGDEVLRRLERHGADTRFVARSPDGMGLWLAVFDSGGEVAAAISKRPDMASLCELIRRHGDEIFADADALVLEIDMDAGVIEEALRLAEAYRKPVYALVANMSIAAERPDFLRRVNCFVCNESEAGILFNADFSSLTPEALSAELTARLRAERIPAMVVTMGSRGAVYAGIDGERGFCPARAVQVQDVSGAGDAFFSGVAAGLTCGKSLAESCEIGTVLAASVLSVSENTCPCVQPEELGLFRL